MRNIGTIAGKEMYTYFASPIAYLVIAAFLVMNGYLFSVILLGSRAASMTSSFADMVIILLFLSPAISMRLLSEEQRSGTIELLLTSPLREVELVLGKWLAAMAFFIVMLALTIPYPLFLLKFGSPDVGPIIGGYIGVILLEGDDYTGRSVNLAARLATAARPHEILATVDLAEHTPAGTPIE